MRRIDSRPVSLCVLFLVLLSAAAGLATRHHSTQHQQGQPGVFDYYLLTLSWSPEFCHGHAQKPECQSGHFGFVVHGLWPQYTSGYPESCSNQPGLADPSSMTDIMPDPGLVAHEWSVHGTCSGLDADAYFKLIRQAFGSVKIPSRFSAPSEPFSMPPQQIKQAFSDANSQLKTENLTVSCGNNYLTAVSVCLTKDLQPTACQALPDCHANTVKVPPVR
jgi:ribonuclease T2